MNGARVGDALASSANNMAMMDSYSFIDVSLIRGTKNGTLLGDAIAIKDSAVVEDVPSYIKHRGALLSSGSVLRDPV